MRKKPKYCSICMILIALSLSFLLTGCSRTSITFDIKKNGKVDVSMLLATINTYDANNSSYEEIKETMKEAEENGWECIPYDQEGYIGYTATNKNMSLKELSEMFSNAEDNFGIKSEGVGIEKKGLKYTINWRMFDDDTAQQFSTIGGLLGMYDGYMNLTINLPYKVKSCNATTVSEDGKTLTWDLSKLDSKSSIYVEFSLINTLITIILVVLVVALIVASIFYILYKRNVIRRNPIYPKNTISSIPTNSEITNPSVPLTNDEQLDSTAIPFGQDTQLNNQITNATSAIDRQVTGSIFCPTCGNKISKSALFCYNCGNSINIDRSEIMDNTAQVTSVQINRSLATQNIKSSNEQEKNTLKVLLVAGICVIIVLLVIILILLISNRNNKDHGNVDNGSHNIDYEESSNSYTDSADNVYTGSEIDNSLHKTEPTEDNNNFGRSAFPEYIFFNKVKRGRCPLSIRPIPNKDFQTIFLVGYTLKYPSQMVIRPDSCVNEASEYLRSGNINPISSRNIRIEYENMEIRDNSVPYIEIINDKVTSDRTETDFIDDWNSYKPSGVEEDEGDRIVVDETININNMDFMHCIDDFKGVVDIDEPDTRMEQLFTINNGEVLRISFWCPIDKYDSEVQTFHDIMESLYYVGGGEYEEGVLFLRDENSFDDLVYNRNEIDDGYYVYQDLINTDYDTLISELSNIENQDLNNPANLEKAEQLIRDATIMLDRYPGYMSDHFTNGEDIDEFLTLYNTTQVARSHLLSSPEGSKYLEDLDKDFWY